jgi:hypothetical protein
MACVCHLFACKLYVFSRFGYINLLKLASASQFAETNRPGQRRTECIVPLCMLDRQARPRWIFYPGPDANGSGRTVCIGQMRRSAGNA